MDLSEALNSLDHFIENLEVEYNQKVWEIVEMSDAGQFPKPNVISSSEDEEVADREELLKRQRERVIKVEKKSSQIFNDFPDLMDDSESDPEYVDANSTCDTESIPVSSAVDSGFGSEIGMAIDDFEAIRKEITLNMERLDAQSLLLEKYIQNR